MKNLIFKIVFLFSILSIIINISMNEDTFLSNNDEDENIDKYSIHNLI